MAVQKLLPQVDLLSEEYVLVPALGKSVGTRLYSSSQLVFSRTRVRLNERRHRCVRIEAIAESIRSSDALRSDSLAVGDCTEKPKVGVVNGDWKPIQGPASVAQRLRPLSHVTVRDQIIATADEYASIRGRTSRRGERRSAWYRDGCQASTYAVSAMDTDSFCDRDAGELRFRWGNSVVYRRYFQDYQSFVSRPEQIVEAVFQPTYRLGDSSCRFISVLRSGQTWATPREDSNSFSNDG